MNVNTIDTQSESLKSIGFKRIGQQMQDVLEVIRIGHESGAVNLSLTEIRDLYESTYLRRIDLNRVSARVFDLLKAERLVRSTDTRVCSVSGKNVHPVYMPLKQARLVA